DGTGITLTSWSITFTNSEPKTTTNTLGAYTFSGLDPGSYTVGISGTAASHDPTRTATVTNGQATSGVDFAIKPTPGSITGTVVNAYNSSGQRDANEPGVASATAYLDLNANGKLDAQDTFTGSTSIQKLASGPLAGYYAATLNVSGVSSLFSHITVGLNLARAASGGPANLDVALLSPSGLADPARGPSGPDLVHLT